MVPKHLVYPTDVIADPENALAWQLLEAARTQITEGQTNWTECANFVHRKFLGPYHGTESFESFAVSIPAGAAKILDALVSQAVLGETRVEVASVLLIGALCNGS